MNGTPFHFIDFSSQSHCLLYLLPAQTNPTKSPAVVPVAITLLTRIGSKLPACTRRSTTGVSSFTSTTAKWPLFPT
jgi:hypothetical protein